MMKKAVSLFTLAAFLLFSSSCFVFPFLFLLPLYLLTVTFVNIVTIFTLHASPYIDHGRRCFVCRSYRQV